MPVKPELNDHSILDEIRSTIESLKAMKRPIADLSAEADGSKSPALPANDSDVDAAIRRPLAERSEMSLRDLLPSALNDSPPTNTQQASVEVASPPASRIHPESDCFPNEDLPSPLNDSPESGDKQRASDFQGSAEFSAPAAGRPGAVPQPGASQHHTPSAASVSFPLPQCVSQSISTIMHDVENANLSVSIDDEHDEEVADEVSRVASVRHANRNAVIMIIDDEPLNIMTFRQHLKGEGYHNFICCEDSRKALNQIRDNKPDVLLLDINMPEVSGLDILRVLGIDPELQHIPILVLTADTDPKVRKHALELGASDFLSKPVEPDELIPRVRNAVILKQHFDMVASQAARLERQVERRTRQLEATRQQLILSLARAAEHRDDDTGNHVLRVGRYASIIAEGMGYPDDQLLMLEQAAQLHDVGKIGIPDSILFKPGKLDPAEYELMQKHCALGKQIIQPISEKDFEILKTHTRRGEQLLHVRSSPLLMLAARIAQTHHERFDGSGYPLGLSGTDIPLEGRIVAVADVYDALSSARPYKKPFSREKCFRILEEGRGTHFDPDVLDAFFRLSERIVETQMNLMDHQPKVVGGEYVTEDEHIA